MNQGNPFAKLSSDTAPASFKEALYRRLTVLERRAARIRMSYLVALSLASLAALAASVWYLWQTVMASGFADYLTVAFKDGAALAFSRDLGYSLLESLPALGIALALATGLAAAWSLWSFTRVIRQRAGGFNFA